MTKAVAIMIGANRESGRAIAAKLAEDFAAVVFVTRDHGQVEQAERLVREAGAEVMVIAIDLSCQLAARLVVDRTLMSFGRIDALINVADAVPHLDWFEVSNALWEAMGRDAERQIAVRTQQGPTGERSGRCSGGQHDDRRRTAEFDGCKRIVERVR